MYGDRGNWRKFRITSIKFGQFFFLFKLRFYRVPVVRQLTKNKTNVAQSWPVKFIRSHQGIIQKFYGSIFSLGNSSTGMNVIVFYLWLKMYLMLSISIGRISH